MNCQNGAVLNTQETEANKRCKKRILSHKMSNSSPPPPRLKIMFLPTHVCLAIKLEDNN